MVRPFNLQADELTARADAIDKRMAIANRLVKYILAADDIFIKNRLDNKDYGELSCNLQQYGGHGIKFSLAPKSLELQARLDGFVSHGDDIKRRFSEFFELINGEEFLEEPNVYENLAKLKMIEKEVTELFDITKPPNIALMGRGR